MSSGEKIPDELRRILLWPSNAEEQRILDLDASWEVSTLRMPDAEHVTVCMRLRFSGQYVTCAEQFHTYRLIKRVGGAGEEIAERTAPKWEMLIRNAMQMMGVSFPAPGEKQSWDEALETSGLTEAQKAAMRGHSDKDVDPNERITVCDACLTSLCWQSLMCCDKAKSAGTVKMTRAELVRLGREHPSNFRTDEELSRG